LADKLLSRRLATPEFSVAGKKKEQAFSWYVKNALPLRHMEIFLSWSGHRSKAVAEALRLWLPKVNPAFKPWLSTADIDKGARWASNVAERLEAARAGIVCLTPSNLHADWILWEAGALSKTTKNLCLYSLDRARAI
jgi:hypothetical protein